MYSCVYEESMITTCKMTRLSSVAQETITEGGQFQNPKPQSGRSRSHNLSISLVFKPLPWLGILLLWWRSIVECHKIYPYVKRAIVCLTKQEILSFSVTRWWTRPSHNCTYTNLCFHIADRLSIVISYLIPLRPRKCCFLLSMSNQCIPNLVLNDPTIVLSDKVKYLGVIVDDKLRLQEHV